MSISCRLIFLRTHLYLSRRLLGQILYRWRVIRWGKTLRQAESPADGEDRWGFTHPLNQLGLQASDADNHTEKQRCSGLQATLFKPLLTSMHFPYRAGQGCILYIIIYIDSIPSLNKHSVTVAKKNFLLTSRKHHTQHSVLNSNISTKLQIRSSLTFEFWTSRVRFWGGALGTVKKRKQTI